MKAIILFITIFSFSYATSQQNALKSIKNLYYKANADNYQSHTVKMNTMQAAIGLQTTDVVFYYDSWQIDPDESSYKLAYRVVKIEVSYNIAASANYKIEYLLNDDENLVFYFKKVEGAYENLSLRYYLDKNKLIKAISKNIAENGKSEEYSDMKNFKQADIDFAKQYIQKSKKYIAFFNEMIILESIDK
ncbi:MAG: hypothetical protein B6I20_06560 [Bacteroidetes bacterium 4572_117]|nr:MAG: hypothetical protein B6I20_06560 [Bacteroidetes bacterium 4572_117]